MNQDEPIRDDPLMRRIRARLDHAGGLSADETARLARVRQRAFAARRRSGPRFAMPAYAAVAASVMLVATLWVLRPGADPLPPQMALLEDLEMLLVLEESDIPDEPEFLAWAVDEREY